MDYMPSPSAFDHVISVFYVDGEEYWIDGTRNFQKTSLDNRGVGDFQKGLVIRQGESQFSDVVAPQKHLKIRALDEVLTATAYDEPVSMQVTVGFEGAEAEDMRAYIASDGIKAFEKDLLNFYLRIYPNMQEVSGLTSSDDSTRNRLTFTGEYAIPDYFDLSQEQLTINLFGENIGGIASLPTVKERSMPLALYNGFVAQHTIRFNLPEEIEWELDTNPYVLEDESTRYVRTLEAEPTHIAIQHEYVIKQDHVPTQAMSNHIANLHKIRDSLYFSVWVSNTLQEDPSANQLRSRLRDALKRRWIDQSRLNSRNMFIYDYFSKVDMFGLFKSDPTKKLRKQYDIKLEQAMLAQRKGDIKTYSMLTAEAEELWQTIEVHERAKDA